MIGRKPIYIPYEYIDDDNVIEAVSKALSANEINKLDIEFLHNYAKGIQPILDRVKTVRPEINNRIVENHALEIVNFKVGFVFGEPVQYILRGKCELSDTTEDADVNALNELMQYDGKAGKDRQLAEWLNECGIGFRMVLPYEGEDKPFETYILNPAETLIARSYGFKHEALMGITTSKNINAEGNTELWVNVYTPDRFYFLVGVDGVFAIQKTEVNPLGFIPIIEYENNPYRMGSFENVIGLCDALNNIASNTLDDIEQTVQSITWFHNCDISSEDFDSLSAKGLVKTKSTDTSNQASVKILTNKLDTNQTKDYKESIYQQLLNIACVPDRRASAGGNTGQALIIGEGWVMAEATAKSFEQTFTNAEQEFLKVVLEICKRKKNAPDQVKALKLHDIVVKFTRNKTDNLLTKTQGLMNMLQAGIHPRIAIANCGLFSDPEQVYVDSAEYMEKIIYSGNSTQIETTTEQMISNALKAVTDELGVD